MSPYTVFPNIFIRGILTSDDNLCQLMIPESSYKIAGTGTLISPFLIQSDTPGIDQTFQCLCIEPDLSASGEGTTYFTADPYVILAGYSEQQINQLIWLLLHGYPVISAQQLFLEAGVDPAAPPALNDIDAFTAMQLAVWSLKTPTMALALDTCGGFTLDPKSARIAQTASYLLAQARAFGSEPPAPPRVSILTDSTTTIRQCGHQQCVGPYSVEADPNIPIAVTATSGPPGASIVDAGGNIRTSFASGESFFVCVPGDSLCASTCLTIGASITGTQVLPLIFQDNGPATTQNMASVYIAPQQLLAESSLQICLQNSLSSRCCMYGPRCGGMCGMRRG